MYQVLDGGWSIEMLGGVPRTNQYHMHAWPGKAKKRVCVGWWVGGRPWKSLSEGFSGRAAANGDWSPWSASHSCHAMLPLALATRTALFFTSTLSQTIYFHKTNIEKREKDVRMTTGGVRKSGRIHWVEKKTDKKLHLAGGQRL